MHISNVSQGLEPAKSVSPKNIERNAKLSTIERIAISKLIYGEISIQKSVVKVE